MFHKILVATDFSKSSRAALLAAISIAGRSSGRVEVIHVSNLHEYPYGSSVFTVPTSSLEADIRGKLEDFFPTSLYPNSDRHLVLGGPISEEIIGFARKKNFDLMVIGTHGRGTIARAVLGSVAQKVTRDSEIPVMVVRDHEHMKERYQGFDRILAPTDFSEVSYTALKLGIQFSNFLKADLHYVHVIDTPALTDLNGLYPFLTFAIPPHGELDVNLTLQKDLENEYFVGNHKVTTLIGDPVREILAYAEDQKMDFIVMGTHGRKGMERALVGSVAAGVIARSKVPVITISANLK